MKNNEIAVSGSPPKAEATGSNPVGCALNQQLRDTTARKKAGASELSPSYTKKRTLHRRLIDEILEQFEGARDCRFMASLRKLPEANYTTELLADDPDWVRMIRFVPDAWLFDLERRAVVLFEIVDTHDLSDAKFECMVELAWALDQDCWSLVLIRVDRHGRTAFNMLGASLASINDNVLAGRPVERVCDWAKYTIAATEQVPA